jgi:thiol:disulfide interchange protein DsbA|tara:strand:- start:481 stop:1122 length:642 start_codon:yes stop_codon:yes gene_type:complete
MNHWIKRITFLMLLLPMAMCQAETEKYEAGVHYEVLPQPIRTADATKIEVNEVFSYTCGHCFNFEAVLHPWSKNLAADVDFQQTPAVWQPSLEPFARAYYSAVMLGVLDQTHMTIFEALHVKKQPLRSEEDFAAIFDSAGVDSLRFSKAYNSFGMTSMVNQAKARVRGYRVQGTPEVIVNGKYRVSSRNAGGFDGMLNVADFLIEKERNAKAK